MKTCAMVTLTETIARMECLWVIKSFKGDKNVLGETLKSFRQATGIWFNIIETQTPIIKNGESKK